TVVELPEGGGLTAPGRCEHLADRRPRHAQPEPGREQPPVDEVEVEVAVPPNEPTRTEFDGSVMGRVVLLDVGPDDGPEVDERLPAVVRHGQTDERIEAKPV